MCPESLHRQLVPLKHAMDLGTSVLLQYALCEFISRGYLKAHLRRTVAEYRARRDTLVDGLSQPGDGCWKIEKPLATMFVWARIPEPFQAMGSLEFSKRLLKEAGVAVSAGIGFGQSGEGHVRFALVENRHRIRQAVRGIRRFLRSAD